MTPPELFFYAAEALLVVAILIWFFTGPWQSLLIDVSRQRHFELRDKLFMIAVGGRIDFDDPVYLSLREWLNGHIRMAHANVPGDIFAAFVAFRGTAPNIRTVKNEIQKFEDEGIRNEMISIHNQAIIINFTHMVIRSPIILVLLTAMPIALLNELISGGVRAFLSWVTDLAQAADDNRGGRPTTGGTT